MTEALAFVTGALVAKRRRASLMSGASAGARLLGRTLLVASVVTLLVLGVGPRAGRYRVLTVLSGSMAPTMPVGALVVALPIPLSEVRVGDVITFQSPTSDRSVVTHRVVEILEDGPEPVVRTQGDANDSPDPWAARLLEGPAWRTEVVVPAAGYVLMALRSPLARGLALVGAPFMLGVLLMLRIWARSPGAQDLLPGVPVDLIRRAGAGGGAMRLGRFAGAAGR